MGKEAVTDPDLEINNVMRRGRGAGGEEGGKTHYADINFVYM